MVSVLLDIYNDMGEEEEEEEEYIVISLSISMTQMVINKQIN